MSNTVNQPVELEVDKQTQLLEEVENRASRAGSVSKAAIAGAIVAFEVNPITNEGLRYGALALAIAETHNPVVGAVALGGSTLAVEGAGALAAASLLTADKASKAVSWVNKKTSKLVSSDAKMSPIVESGVALTLGTPIVLGLKQREDPTRTVEKNRRHGLLVAGSMAGIFAIEGALISEGALDYTDIRKVGAAVVGLAGLHFGALKLRQHRSKATKQDNVI